MLNILTWWNSWQFKSVQTLKFVMETLCSMDYVGLLKCGLRPQCNFRVLYIHFACFPLGIEPTSGIIDVVSDIYKTAPCKSSTQRGKQSLRFLDSSLETGRASSGLYYKQQHIRCICSFTDKKHKFVLWFLYTLIISLNIYCRLLAWQFGYTLGNVSCCRNIQRYETEHTESNTNSSPVGFTQKRPAGFFQIDN